MGLRINTNVPSLAAQRQIGMSQRKSEGAMKALASGNRFDNPGESAADYAISEKLRGQAAGMKAARMNAENAQSFIQVAEGGLNEQNNLLIRMRELSVQAASDTYSDKEREFMQIEFEQLAQEVDRIAQTTSFGSSKILAGESKKYEFQVGAYKGSENVITYDSDADTTGGTLNVDGLGIDSKSSARDALETIDEAMTQVSAARASFGAIMSRMESAINSTGVQAENLEQARSRIGDTEIAGAVSNMYRQQALQQYQMAVLNEANRFPASVIKLIA